MFRGSSRCPTHSSIRRRWRSPGAVCGWRSSPRSSICPRGSGPCSSCGTCWPGGHRRSPPCAGLGAGAGAGGGLGERRGADRAGRGGGVHGRVPGLGAAGRPASDAAARSLPQPWLLHRERGGLPALRLPAGSALHDHAAVPVRARLLAPGGGCADPRLERDAAPGRADRGRARGPVRHPAVHARRPCPPGPRPRPAGPAGRTGCRLRQPRRAADHRGRGHLHGLPERRQGCDLLGAAQRGGGGGRRQQRPA